MVSRIKCPKCGAEWNGINFECGSKDSLFTGFVQSEACLENEKAPEFETIPGTVPGPGEYPPEVQAMAKAERKIIEKAIKPKAPPKTKPKVKTYEPEDGGGETD